MRCIRIEPDGTVYDLLSLPLEAGRSQFRHTTVVACHCPMLPVIAGDVPWVMVVDDFGAQDAPLNRKAWTLYGRSPIYGTAFLGRDDDGPVNTGLFNVVKRDIDQWPIGAYAIEHFTGEEPERPRMLATREDADHEG